VAGEERFVGRQEELELLGRRLADARAGSGRVVLISGPAGIGKTRLVEEFMAVAGGIATGWGTAVTDAGMPALWPWTRALRGLPGPRAALASLVAGDTQAAYGSADDAAATTFAADTRVVDALADQAVSGTGLLLVLDDLHWADQATIRLLERVATDVRRLPLLVVGTHRDGAGEPLHGVYRQGATEQLHLGPLDPEDARTLLLMAVSKADPAAVNRAAQLSGGSPLYLRTLTRVAADRLRGTGSWDDTVGEAPAFRHLVAAALRSAGPDAAAAVEALSVLGSEAEPEIVARLLHLDSGGTAIELADPTRRPLARLWAHIWRSDVAVRRADPAAAEIEISGMRALADGTGLPLVRWHLLRREASLAALTGRFDTCRRLGRQAAELAEPWQDHSARYTHIGQTVCLALLRGDPSDLAPEWTDFVGDVERQPVVARALLAAALLLSGRRDEARNLYEPVVPALLAARTALDAAAVAYLVYLAPAFNDVPACLAIGDWLTEIFGDAPAIGVGVVVYYGSVARMRGQLALAAGQPDTAIGYFEEALKVDAMLGARPFLAQGRLGLAQALAATGDLARAAELARAAAAEARRLDMPSLLRAADTFLTATAGKARAQDPLTDREREVLALVAQALTNREVATALVLSERTVESHVRRILAKTGLSSRTELTRWYLERRR
jgi:DNA-binding CsgD family transcriptional regulator